MASNLTPKISVLEAANTYNVCSATIRRRIADGTLKAHRVGPKLIRLDVAELEAAFGQIPTVGKTA